MLRFINSIKKKYCGRLLAREEQWPPSSRRNKLINLQLIETSRADSFPSSTSENEDVKKTPICHADLFHGNQNVKHVKKVLVEGHAGIGKTTLSLMLSEEWAQGKVLQQFDCVLLLPLREKKVAEASCLSDLLKLLHASEDVRSAVAKEMESNEGEGLLLIADGWDELSETARSKDSFLYDLLFGDILPFASVLVTSRPLASSDIRKLPLIDRLVAVMGFDKDDVKAYVRSEYENDLDKYSRLLKQIESNPLLQSVCCVPLNCAITCYLWETLKEELPSTMTGLYTQIILSVVYRDIKKSREYDHLSSLSNFDAIPESLQPAWWRLCEFAFNAISKNQVVFLAEELESILPETKEHKLSAFGLLQFSPSLLPVGHGLSSSFLHLTFQEYLAAMHISTLPAQQQISVCERYSASSHFTMVWRFLFGFLSPKDRSRKAMVQRALTHSHVEGILLNFGESLNVFEPVRNLLLCHCAFEYQDQHITSFVSEYLKNRNFSVANNTLNYAVMCKVIAQTTECHSLALRIDGCGIGDDELEWLIEPLANANGLLKVKVLDLPENSVSNAGVSKLFKMAYFAFLSLKQLHIQNKKIDGNGINAIFHPVNTNVSYHSLENLNLSDNPLAKKGFKELESAILADSIPKLHKLQLSNILTQDANINGEAIASLTEALAIKCHQLNTLNLSRNVLSVPGATALGRILPKLTQRVDNFFLALNEVELGDRGLTALVGSLPEVCDLHLFGIRHNDIHYVGLLQIIKKLCSRRLSCVQFDLIGNPLGYISMFLLSSMMSSENYGIQGLYLSSCQLTDLVCHKSFLRCCMPIQNACIKSLDLSGNCFSGGRIKWLAGLLLCCAGNLRTLVTTNCQISSDDLKSLLEILCDRLPSTSCKLQQWFLTDNEIDDVGAAALIDLCSLFPRLIVVFINGNHISVKMKECLKRRCKKNSELLQNSLQFENRAIVGQKKIEVVFEEWENTHPIFFYKQIEVFYEWRKTSSASEFEDLKTGFFRMWSYLLTLISLELAMVICDEETEDSPKPSQQASSIQSTTSLSPEDTALDPLNRVEESNQDDASPVPSSDMPLLKTRLHERLNTCDHLKEVIEAVWDVRAIWHTFGLVLGVNPHTLDAISAQHRDIPDDCLKHTIQHWMDGEKTEPTWEALIDALESKLVGFTQLAQTLREKYNS